MQSGSDDVLKRMNRWYTVAEYLGACHRIRRQLDRPAFTADILVGFPGETDAHFEETLATATEAGFAKVHAFPFSARPGTAAWQHAGRVDAQDVRARRMRLSEHAAELGEAYRRSLAGARETVVLEGFAGLAGRYQRVRIDPRDIDGVPPASIDVRLEVCPGGQDGVRSELRGHPLRTPPR
jgi:tRNA A37 methylthiotransferase MiaB